MKYPCTADELRHAGYEYDNDSACRGCQQPIEWWITPGGKKIPMSILKSGNMLKTNEEKRQPHFADCPNVSDFRR